VQAQLTHHQLVQCRSGAGQGAPDVGWRQADLAQRKAGDGGQQQTQGQRQIDRQCTARDQQAAVAPRLAQAQQPEPGRYLMAARWATAVAAPTSSATAMTASSRTRPG
jgi:hypothetical protein